MTARKKTINPLEVRALKAAPRPRGRPAMGLRKACLYTISVWQLLKLGWPRTEAVRQVARQYKKTEEHIWACRKLVRDEVARRKANNDPRPVYEDD